MQTPYGFSVDVDLPYCCRATSSSTSGLEAMEPIAQEVSAGLERVLAAVAS